MRVELEDIQGFVRHGYPFFDAAAYCVFELDDPPRNKLWLHALRQGPVPYIDDATRRAELLKDDDSGAAIAFTARGLARLGLSARSMSTFVSEFQEGMAVERRARLLGDDGPSDFRRWDWGGRQPVDGLLIVFAPPRYYDPCDASPVTAAERDPDACPQLDAVVNQIAALPGCPRFVRRLNGRLRIEQGTGVSREPFGFVDGVSQPDIEGLSRKGAPAGARGIRTGEFVLGYRNEIGRLPASPSVSAADDPRDRLPVLTVDGRRDLGRNGTFLVMRQLEQDKAAFDAFVGSDERLAARLIGRWRHGAPLVRYAEDRPGMTQDELVAGNDFNFHAEDRHGFRCPIGSHIRRANPRDALATELGITPAEAQELVNQHRLLRRGRAYSDGGRRGMVFICLNASIERQFEFVQSSWLMHPQFGGLHGEYDPLLGPGGRMTLQHPLLGECVQPLPRFVTVRGGGYFFLPGLRALNYLAHLP